MDNDNGDFSLGNFKRNFATDKVFYGPKQPQIVVVDIDALPLWPLKEAERQSSTPRVARTLATKGGAVPGTPSPSKK